MITSRNNMIDRGDHFHEEEDWGIVSLDGEEPMQQERSGVLILPGEEEEATNEAFSVPGTDSVPSEIDTLEIAMGLVGNSVDSNDETWRPEDEELTQNTSMKAATRKKLFLLILAVAFGITSLVGGLAWERQMRLKETNLRLQQVEEELRQLKEAKIKEEAPTRKPVEEDSCNSDWWQDEEGDNILASNCYFRVTLGDCGRNAKDSLNDLATGVYDTFDYLGKRFWGAASSFHDSETKMAGFSKEAFEEASMALASTVASAADAINAAFHEVSAVVDESILRVVEATRDAIDDATSSTRPE